MIRVGSCEGREGLAKEGLVAGRGFEPLTFGL
jgi:hypothetical protein